MTGFKWFLVISFIAFLGFGIWDALRKKNDGEADKKDITDSVTNSGKRLGSSIDTGFKGVGKSFDKTNGKLDSGFNGIEKGKNKKIINSAIIGMAPTQAGYDNPEIIKTDKIDSFDVKLWFKNYGKGVASNVHGSVMIVFRRYGKLFAQYNKPPKDGNKSTQWQANQDISYNVKTNIIGLRTTPRSCV